MNGKPFGSFRLLPAKSEGLTRKVRSQAVNLHHVCHEIFLRIWRTLDRYDPNYTEVQGR